MKGPMLAITAVVLLAAVPAYAEFVLVTTSVGGDGPSEVITGAANQTATMFEMMVDAGANPQFMDMLYFDLDLEQGAWVLRASFVTHVPDPRDIEAVASVATSHDLTKAFVLTRYTEPVEDPPRPDVVVNQLNVYSTLDRLVLTASLTNTSPQPAANVSVGVLMVDGLTIRQTVVDGNVLMSVNATGDEPCYDEASGNGTFTFTGCFDGTITLQGLIDNLGEPKTIPAKSTISMRLVVETEEIRNIIHRGMVAAVTFEYDLGGTTHATDSRHVRVR